MNDTVSSRHEFYNWFHSIGMSDSTGGVVLKVVITIVVAALLYFVSKKWLSVLLKRDRKSVV